MKNERLPIYIYILEVDLFKHIYLRLPFFFAEKKLQLTYSGLPGVDGCLNKGNPKVVFYFECGNHVGQPKFER